MGLALLNNDGNQSLEDGPTLSLAKREHFRYACAKVKIMRFRH